MDQHLISEVYLKQFGYIDKNKQWRVCILDKSKFHLMLKSNKKWVSHKSIGSFLVINNHFDFEDYSDMQFARLIEDGSASVETYLPILIKELESSLQISSKGEAILAHYISNLYVRTSNFDLLFNDLISLNGYERFLEECVMFETDVENLRLLIKNPKFNSPKNIKNLSRFLFWNYFCKRLAYFEYYIIKPFPGKGWVSSDNPVILNNHVNEDSLLSLDTEIVFPFSPEFVIILKMSKSKRVSQIFDNTIFKKVTVASSDINDKINEIISDNAEKFVIIPKLEGVNTF